MHKQPQHILISVSGSRLGYPTHVMFRDESPTTVLRMPTRHVGVTHGWRHSIKHHLWHKHTADCCYGDKILSKQWSWCWEFIHTHTYTHNTHTRANRLPEKEAKLQDNQSQNSVVCTHSQQIFPYYFTTRAALACQEVKHLICQPISKFH